MLLAPAVASALIVCLVSGSAVGSSALSTGVMVAETSMPWASTVLAPVVARLVMFTRLTTTPAPMPTPVLVAVVPFASPATSVLAELARVTGPSVAVTVRPSESQALETVVMMLIVTAPATESLPSLVAAAGVLELFVLLPVVAVDTALPWPSHLSAVLLTPAFGSLGAPGAAASVTLSLAEDPVAESETAEAVTLRATLAVTSSSTIASARASAMPAVSASTSPRPTVSVAVCCVASRVTSPGTTSVAPVPRRALVVTVERLSPTEGEMAMPPPEPLTASALVSASVSATISSESTEVSTTLSMTAAVVVTLLIVMPKEAPMPILGGSLSPPESTTTK